MLVDTHAHLTSEGVVDVAEQLLERAEKARISKIVNVCTDAASLDKGVLLKNRYPWIYNAAATTPHDVVAQGEDFFPAVEQAVKEKLLIAIGETGLDYFYEHSPRNVQKEFLSRYFSLALRANLPLIIHCRDAFADLFAQADSEYTGAAALLHCFTGSLEEAKGVLDRGWLISFSGIVTYKKSEVLREVARFVPIDRMVVETDTPYLAPKSRRGKQNEPAYIVETASLIAEEKKIPFEEFCATLSENSCKFFQF